MNNYYQPQYPAIQQMQLPQQQYYQQPQTINCKIVENADSVRYQEVPFGGYGVFIQADLSAIYVKNWNVDGTTQIIPYLKTVVAEEESDPYSDVLSKIQNSISELTKKIDEIKTSTSTTARAKKGA